MRHFWVFFIPPKITKCECFFFFLKYENFVNDFFLMYNDVVFEGMGI